MDRRSDRAFLNVGGSPFETRLSTLEKGDTFFSSLVRHASEAEANGRLFIDRDPTHFRFVLNWLRGSRVLPPSTPAREELRCEADYYCMHDLVAAIDAAPAPPSVSHILAAELPALRRAVRERA